MRSGGRAHAVCSIPIGMISFEDVQGTPPPFQQAIVGAVRAVSQRGNGRGTALPYPNGEMVGARRAVPTSTACRAHQGNGRGTAVPCPPAPRAVPTSTACRAHQHRSRHAADPQQSADREGEGWGENKNAPLSICQTTLRLALAC